MGKTKHRKPKRHNDRPLGIPSEQELMEELPKADDVTETVEAALEKIKGISSEDKECGASIIAQLTDDEKFVSHLIESGGIKIMAPLLIDSSPAVRHTVCGCLRNLSMNSEVAEQMVEQDVMTPLIALFKVYSSKWAPTACSNGKIDSKKETFIEACNLLSCLCESSSTALDIFNRNKIIGILFPCLNIDTFGLDVTLAVVECLHTVTENNPDVSLKTGQIELDMLQSLISISPTQAAHIKLRTLASGVILNLCVGKFDVCEPSGCSILKVLDHTLNIAVQCDVERIAEDISCLKLDRKNQSIDPDELKKKLLSIDEQLKSLDFILSAKQTALEILTNICSTDEMDADETSSCASSDDIADLEDISSIPVDFSSSLPCEVRGFIINEKIILKVLQQIVIPNRNINDLFQETSHGILVLKRLHTVRCRALLCINNVVQEFTAEELGSSTELFQLWKDLSVLVFSQTDPSDSEQLEAATGSVRAVLQKLAETNTGSHFCNLTENDLKLFFDMWQQCTDNSAKVNILRSVGTIGCILANLKQPLVCNIIKIIGIFLIEACVRGSELWVISEALDAIFDVFSEDHLDCITQEIGLIDKLKQILPLFKGKGKLHHKSPEHAAIIMTSKTNLLRFLKYKEKYHRQAIRTESKATCV